MIAIQWAKKFRKTAVVFGAALAAGVAAIGQAPAHAEQGVNYAWARYPGFSTWLSSNFSSEKNIMASDFKLIASGGKNKVVRIWIFPDGTSNVSLNGQVSSTFISNIDSVCSAANSAGLAVYVTFFSAWNQGDATTGNEANIWTYDINPILKTLIGHYNIFGVDVMNEFDGTGNNSAFCKYEVGKVLGSYNIYTTASSNQSYSKAMSDESGVGGNFRDIHIYGSSPVSIPTNSSGFFGVIGEVGGSSGSGQEAALQSAESQYSGKGWSAILAWDFATDDSLELTNAGQNWSTVSYNSAGSWWNSN
jgi:hypothetical protein